MAKTTPNKITSVFIALVLAVSTLPVAALGMFITPVKAHAAETVSSQINIEAPVSITFGGSTAYDVANPATSVSDVATFKNNSATDIAYVSSIKCEEYSAGSIDKVLSTTDSAKPLNTQKLFSIFRSDKPEKVMNFGYGSGVNALEYDYIGSNLVIDPSTSLNCTFRLNLTNTSDVSDVAAKINANAADGGSTWQGIAKVSYTFSTYNILDEAGNNGPDDLAALTLTDKNTGKVYGLSRIKYAAEDIAKKGTSSKHYSRFAAYLASDTGVYANAAYSCTTTWNNYKQNVRIIGINHDYLYDSYTSGNTTIKTAENIYGSGFNGLYLDGGAKAGLTFQFVDALYDSTMVGGFYIDSSDYNAGGWERSNARAQFSPGGKIWGYVPALLQNSIKTVAKLSDNVGRHLPDTPGMWDITTVPAGGDKIFLASASEIFPIWEFQGDTSNGAAGPYVYLSEGPRYAYWERLGLNPSTPNEMAKLGGQCRYVSYTNFKWYFRSPSYKMGTAIEGVAMDGSFSYILTRNPADTAYRPCFCLQFAIWIFSTQVEDFYIKLKKY